MSVFVLIEGSSTVQMYATYAIETLLSAQGYPYWIVDASNVPEEPVTVLYYGDRASVVEDLLRKGHAVIAVFLGWKNVASLTLLRLQEMSGWMVDQEGSLGLPVLGERGQGRAVCRSFVSDGRWEHVLWRWKGDGTAAVGWTRKGNGWLAGVDADLIGSAFFFLSRVEEANSKVRDSHGRFPAGASLTGRGGCLHIPVVDVYGEIIDQLIQQAYDHLRLPICRLCRWPRGAPLAVLLSHDVHEVKKWTPKRTLYEAGRSLLALCRGDPQLFRRNVSSFLSYLVHHQEPYWQFEALTRMEQTFGMHSTFCFCPFGPAFRRRETRMDPTYRVPSEKLAGLAKTLLDGGWEIGLHGTYGSFDDGERLSRERSDLEEQLSTRIMGVRQHYLRFDRQVTWRAQQEARLEYDTTLGFADQAGFRAGTCLPFHPFDADRERPMPLLELPLTAMDGTFLSYLGYDMDRMEQEIHTLFHTVQVHRGLFVFLLHPHLFDENEYPGARALYERFLTEVHVARAAVMTGSQIAGWWRARESVKWIGEERGSGWHRWTLEAGRAITGLSVELIPPSGCTVNAVEVEGVSSIQTVEKNERWRIHLRSIPSSGTFDIVVQWRTCL